MRKITSFIAFLLTPYLLSGQTIDLPPLKPETFNIGEYSRDSCGRDYIDYKVFTTISPKVKKKIPKKYRLRDFYWDYLYINESHAISKFHKLLFEKMKVRKPLKGEYEKGLYFEAVIGTDSVAQFWCDDCDANIVRTTYLTLEYSSDSLLRYSVPYLFNGTTLNLESSLRNTDGKRIPINRISYCIKPHEVENVVTFVIGLQFDKSLSTDHYKGSVSMKINSIPAPYHETITRKSVGDKIRIGQQEYTILEYEKGMVHLEGPLSENLSRADLLFGRGGRTYRKYDFIRSIPSVEYYAYRKNPHLTYEQFREKRVAIKNLPKDGKHVSLFDVEYDVPTIYIVDNLGFELVDYTFHAKVLMKNADLKVSY